MTTDTFLEFPTGQYFTNLSAQVTIGPEEEVVLEFNPEVIPQLDAGPHEVTVEFRGTGGYSQSHVVKEKINIPPATLTVTASNSPIVVRGDCNFGNVEVLEDGEIVFEGTRSAIDGYITIGGFLYEGPTRWAQEEPIDFPVGGDMVVTSTGKMRGNFKIKAPNLQNDGEISANGKGYWGEYRVGFGGHSETGGGGGGGFHSSVAGAPGQGPGGGAGGTQNDFNETNNNRGKPGGYGAKCTPGGRGGGFLKITVRKPDTTFGQFINNGTISADGTHGAPSAIAEAGGGGGGSAGALHIDVRLDLSSTGEFHLKYGNGGDATYDGGRGGKGYFYEPVVEEDPHSIAETVEGVFELVKVDLATDSDNDGDIDTQDDAIESNLPGRYVWAGPDTRAEIQLNISPKPMSGILKLDASAGGTSITVWDWPTGGTSLDLPVIIPLAGQIVPVSLYVQGEQVGQVALDLVYKSNGVEKCWDRNIRLTVIRLNSQTVSTHPANRARTTLGIGEEVTCSVDPSTIGTTVSWGWTGGGSLSANTGTSITFSSSHSPSTSIVSASVGTAPYSDTLGFTVIAPTSITITNPQDVGLGNPGPPNNQIGAYTIYTMTVNPTTTVSFYNAQFRENIPQHQWTWPNGTQQTSGPKTVLWKVNQSNQVPDNISDGPCPIGYIHDGTGYVDFNYIITWKNEYRNKDGNWVEFATMNTNTEFSGVNQRCRETYMGVVGGWQGPWQ